MNVPKFLWKAYFEKIQSLEEISRKIRQNTVEYTFCTCLYYALITKFSELLSFCICKYMWTEVWPILKWSNRCSIIRVFKDRSLNFLMFDLFICSIFFDLFRSVQKISNIRSVRYCFFSPFVCSIDLKIRSHFKSFTLVEGESRQF